MTNEQLKIEIGHLKQKALQMVKNSAPVRTGNLQNSVYARDLEDGGFEIYIDTTQANYAQYTLEQWTHPRWNGKQNPNENWAYEASNEFMVYAKARLQARRSK
jgi:hypothetical protein